MAKFEVGMPLDKVLAELRQADAPTLVAQQVAWGAIVNCLEFLLDHGCTEEVARSMLGQVREALLEANQMAKERGLTIKFEDPVFHQTT